MADIKTVKNHMAEIFEMKESFDMFLKDTESFDDGRRCYAIYQFIYELTMSTNYDIELTEFDTRSRKAYIKVLMDDGKFTVHVCTIPNPTKREIDGLVHITIYEQPSGHHIADFSFNTGKCNVGGMPFETTIGYMLIDSEKHQALSDIAFAIMKTIDWYKCGK